MTASTLIPGPGSVLPNPVSWMQNTWSNRNSVVAAKEAQSNLPKLDSEARRLTHIARLESDWDSYGSVPISPNAIRAALVLIGAAAVLFEARPFAILPLSGGGIQLEWRSPRGEIEVEIGSDNTLGYLFVDKQRGERLFAEKDNASVQEVLDFLSKSVSK